MFAIILLCVAVLCLAISRERTPQTWLAVILTVIALLSICLKWNPL